MTRRCRLLGGCAGFLALGLLGIPSPLFGAGDPPPESTRTLRVGADFKTFVFASFPYESAFLPEDPFGTGMLSIRPKLDAGLERGEYGVRLIAHAVGQQGGGSSMVSIGGGTTSPIPEAVDLSWSGTEGGIENEARVDRLSLELHAPHVNLTAGRQAITFGHALIFTPLDLVMPFHPASIDQDYKPGVDAIRLDGYAGMATQVSLVTAYAGDWDLDHVVIAGYGQTTVGLWDLGVLLGSVRGDRVGGISATGGIGPVAVWADGTYTLPPKAEEAGASELVIDEDPFARVTIGANVKPGQKSFISGELYLQTLGAADPEDYAAQSLGYRYYCGELWALGRYYGAISASYEITPLLGIQGFGLINLADPSALLGPGVRWSVAEGLSLSAGGYWGLGKRPAGTALRSEFGIVPTTIYGMMAAAF